MSEEFNCVKENPQEAMEHGRVAFFEKLSEKYEKELEFLKNVGGLTSVDEGGEHLQSGDKRDWSNVAEHCLTVTAAAEALTNALNLSKKDKERICAASVIHDWYKRALKDKDGQWHNKPTGESGDDKGDIQRAFNKILETVGSDLLSVTTPAYLDRGFIRKTATLPERLLSYLDAITDGSRIVPFGQRLDNAATSPRWKWLADDSEWKNKVEPLLGKGANFFDGQKAQETSTQNEIFEMLKERGITLKTPEDVPAFIRSEIEKQY